MKITLSLTLLIGLLTPHLHAEPALFPAKNALALTVTEDGLVLEGADLVTPDLNNWEVSWPASTENNGMLSMQTEVIEKGSTFPLEDYSKTTRNWWTYGSFTFEQTSTTSSPAGMMARHSEGSIFKVYENEEVIQTLELRDLTFQGGSRIENVYHSLQAYNSEFGAVVVLNNVDPSYTRSPENIWNVISVNVSIYRIDGVVLEYTASYKPAHPAQRGPYIFSNTKRLYTYYPRHFTLEFTDDKISEVFDSSKPYGLYNHSDTSNVLSPVEYNPDVITITDASQTLPNGIVDDGADAIIFEKRVYTNDNGQTWTYYDSPLPADYLSYDEGFFEYVTLPTEENGLTHPVRKRSADKGATWEEVTTNLELDDYSFHTSWDGETQTTTLALSHPLMFILPIYLENWWVLDVHTFQDTFVVLLKHATDTEREHQLLCIPVDSSPLTSTEYPEQMLWDGHWKVEVVREPKVRLTEEDINSAELLDLKYDNRISINLGYPTGRVENVIYGEADIESYPWVYSYELGWHAYFTSNDATIPGAFLWTPEESWLFTCVGYYPFIWSFVEENWIWVDVGEGRTKQWYLYLGDGNWKQIR